MGQENRRCGWLQQPLLSYQGLKDIEEGLGLITSGKEADGVVQICVVQIQDAMARLKVLIDLSEGVHKELVS